uniref:Hyaluronidase n=1 Tax=Sergentomyia schwetzi TaxID=114605 RepID=A0A6B9VLL5_9DIPT|nr:salivary hyaluronidase [Sergentomyia schwetzi]
MGTVVMMNSLALKVSFLFIIYGILLTFEVKGFQIYWNVPTENCQKYGINFETLLTDLGIFHNAGGNFTGEKMRILYNPGLWPSLEHGKIINGGMPHHGNLTLHLDELEKYIEKNIPRNYTGLAVVDMESWRPVFRQNTGWMLVYRNLTQEEVQLENPSLAKALQDDPTNKRLMNELFHKAAKIFEPNAKEFMEMSLEKLKKWRPGTKWGYYGFPYCFNMYGNTNATRREMCPDIVQKENNVTKWLFQAYNHWFPSVYVPEENFSVDERRQLVQGRVKEFLRLKQMFNPRANIYPYVWFTYNLKDNYLTEEDLKNTLSTLKKGKMDGAVIWGSSKNVNSQNLCQELRDYINGTMRKVIEEY